MIAANVVNADIEEARTEFADDGELNACLAERIGESEVVMRDPGDIERL